MVTQGSSASSGNGTFSLSSLDNLRYYRRWDHNPIEDRRQHM
jgi:hypothetical protein